MPNSATIQQPDGAAGKKTLQQAIANDHILLPEFGSKKYVPYCMLHNAPRRTFAEVS